MPPKSNELQMEEFTFKPSTLLTPKLSEMAKQADYPDVKIWQEDQWRQKLERGRNKGKHVEKLGFLTDENGLEISKSQAKEFTELAKVLWNEMKLHGIHPHDEIDERSSKRKSRDDTHLKPRKRKQLPLPPDGVPVYEIDENNEDNVIPSLSIKIPAITVSTQSNSTTKTISKPLQAKDGTTTA
ncbi:hypothetical protein C0992_007153, partial [Termitomyces sp. T32_za158]